MEAHQERVVAEKTELDGKIEILMGFIAGPFFSKLPEAEQKRLRRSEVLADRIAAF
jgi:hypothetical protein